MPATTRLTDAELASVVRLSVLRTARRLRSQRVNTEITLSQVSALVTVRKCGPMSAGEVAAAEQVQPPSMTKILASLEAAGLIDRTAHPEDRRQSIISITAAGRQLLEDEARVRDEWLAVKLSDLSDEDRDKLLQAVDVLDRIGL
ncbi:MarR family transcriptional regulator [soil metagenome]